MAYLLPIPLLVVTVPWLVWSELQTKRKHILVLKPLSTILVILIALLSFFSPGAQPAYSLTITLGLLLSLGGDIALMFESSRAFLVGLVLFLLAHVVYIVAFTIPNGFHGEDLVTGAALLLVAVFIYVYLRPGLGSMRGPVIVYILIICIMAQRALSTFFGNTFTATQAWLISLGALLFMASDLVLAINRFGHPFAKHRLSLFLYYGGQILIALSPSFF